MIATELQRIKHQRPIFEMWVDELRRRKGEWSDFRLHLGVFRSNSALKEADRCLHLMGFALWFRDCAI